MHQELREMSKESTQEASAIHARQLHYDRQIADLSLTISKLQASLRETKRDNVVEDGSGDTISGKSNGDDDSVNQVKMLSDEVMRLRDRVASHSSESLAMRNRLKEAVDRASHAEEKLAMAMANGMESGGGDGMSHTSGNGPSRRRRGVATSPSGSLRSVMKLNPGQGERRERIGKAVDAVDVFAKTTGTFYQHGVTVS
jgi:chromosome segregation ATPase